MYASIKKIIKEEIDKLILEDYESIKEIRQLASDVLLALSEKNLDNVINWHNKSKDSVYLWFASVSLFEVYYKNKEKYQKLKEFLQSSKKTNIYLSNNKYTDKDTKGTYSFIDQKNYNPYLQREINLYYDQNELIEKLDRDIDQSKGFGHEYGYKSLYTTIFYMFYSVLVHELQHAYDDFRSNSKIYKTKKTEKFFNDKIEYDEKKDWEAYMSKIKRYLNLNHEVWARFSQAMDKLRFYNSELVDGEKGMYFKMEMKDLKSVLSDFKSIFHGFHALNDKTKRILLRKVSQFWHIEKEKIDKKNKNPEILREYLEREMVNLKQYFNMSEDEKKKGLPSQYYYFFEQFLEEMDIDFKIEDDGNEMEIVENLPKTHPKINEMFEDWLYEKVENHDLTILDSEYPTWSFFEYYGIVKNQWLIHFTKDAWSIWKEGFKYGVDDMDKLGLTIHLSHFDKEYGGYNFAYLLSDFEKYSKNRHGYKYGDEAVIFQASGIRLWHHGDEEPQVIFYGDTAKNIIPLTEGEQKRWAVRNVENDKPLFESEELKSIVKWIVDNYSQYKNIIKE